MIKPALYKSVAIALMFSIFFGPIGLLYASFWGGLIMTAVGLLVVSAKFWQPILLVWVVCCIWAVGAVEFYNKKLWHDLQSTQGKCE